MNIDGYMGRKRPKIVCMDCVKKVVFEGSEC